MTTSLLLFALIVLLLIGGLIWAVQRFLPIDATIKNVACFIIAVIGLLTVAHRAGVL